MSLGQITAAAKSSGAQEMAVQATFAAPPVSVTALTLAGIGLQDWVLILTLIYTVLQIGWFVFDKAVRARRKGGAA